MGKKIAVIPFCVNGRMAYNPPAFDAHQTDIMDTPCVIITKILFQSLWKLKIDLDSKLWIPRWLELEWSIHGFCDASKEAMSAVIYMKLKKSEGIFVNLYTAIQLYK